MPVLVARPIWHLDLAEVVCPMLSCSCGLRATADRQTQRTHLRDRIGRESQDRRSRDARDTMRPGRGAAGTVACGSFASMWGQRHRTIQRRARGPGHICTQRDNGRNSIHTSATWHIIASNTIRQIRWRWQVFIRRRLTGFGSSPSASQFRSEVSVPRL
ncbi:hypothetical protein LZ31DRAFT_23148 [Colletotrichum somersetense]|nr:hypothetical protein LZ31DRAFT_23148 [Colletotrichum somersetense]